MSRILRSVILFALVVVLGTGASGCSLLPGASRLRSVSDQTNAFHFKIPEKWQAQSDAGFITVYADKELPGPNESLTALSVLVFTSQDVSSTPVAGMVDYLVRARSESRGWKDLKWGKPATVKVGGRDAHAVDVTATGADGKRFESRYLFVRSAATEVFIVAVAPNGDKIADYNKDVERITTNWYWHTTDTGATSDSTSTAP